MKRFGLLFITAIILFASCQLDFSNSNYKDEWRIKNESRQAVTVNFGSDSYTVPRQSIIDVPYTTSITPTVASSYHVNTLISNCFFGGSSGKSITITDKIKYVIKNNTSSQVLIKNNNVNLKNIAADEELTEYFEAAPNLSFYNGNYLLQSTVNYDSDSKTYYVLLV